jgi:hypothetical protein
MLRLQGGQLEGLPGVAREATDLPGDLNRFAS